MNLKEKMSFFIFKIKYIFCIKIKKRKLKNLNQFDIHSELSIISKHVKGVT